MERSRSLCRLPENSYDLSNMRYTQADLDMANRHVADAERHVIRQEEIISGLRMKNADTALAEELLAEFNATLRVHRHDRDRMAAQMGQPT